MTDTIATGDTMVRCYVCEETYDAMLDSARNRHSHGWRLGSPTAAVRHALAGCQIDRDQLIRDREQARQRLSGAESQLGTAREAALRLARRVDDLERELARIRRGVRAVLENAPEIAMDADQQLVHAAAEPERETAGCECMSDAPATDVPAPHDMTCDTCDGRGILGTVTVPHTPRDDRGNRGMEVTLRWHVKPIGSAYAYLSADAEKVTKALGAIAALDTGDGRQLEVTYVELVGAVWSDVPR